MGGCGLLIAICWGMYQAGKHAAIEQQDVVESNSTNSAPTDTSATIHAFDPGTCRQTKKQKLCSEIGDLTQQLQINTTANQNLAEQIKSLTSENDQLKERLVFLQHLVSSSTKNNVSVSIHQFNLKETPTPGQYRYALTLMQNGDKHHSAFKGNLRFLVSLVQNKQHKTIPLTNKQSKRDFPVNFKSFHRFEESFKIPPNTTVENIQVQIFKSGDSKAILTGTAKPMF